MAVKKTDTQLVIEKETRDKLKILAQQDGKTMKAYLGQIVDYQYYRLIHLSGRSQKKRKGDDES